MPMTAVITWQPEVTKEEAEQERKKHDIPHGDMAGQVGFGM